MNTSIIIDDIRKRSIKIQRDKILEKIRQEEELEATTLPRRIILEAEERAKEKIALQGWKRNLSFLVIFLGAGYAIYRILIAGRQKLSNRKPVPKPLSASFAIQTENTVEEEDEEEEFDNHTRKPAKVTFDIDNIDSKSHGDKEMEKLKIDYPKHWRGFERDYEPDWLRSNVTGQMKFGFYNKELRIAIDMITSEMLQYPNDHFSTQEDFENSIYDRQLKKDLSEHHSITYKIVNIDLELEED